MNTIRIALTGGGTGGHVFPLAAVADALRTLGKESVDIRYYGPGSKWNGTLTAHNIPLHHITGAKLRRYASIQNIVDIPKFFFGLFQALIKLYMWMPDVVFSKGGPGALAIVLAAAWYRIPVVIHESDAVPGFTNRISAKFARRIGISFQGATKYFPARKIFVAGNPVRAALADLRLENKAAKSQLRVEQDVPLLLVLGGSQGAKVVNELVESALPMLISFCTVYHQTGEGNAIGVTDHMGTRTEGPSSRYHTTEFMNESEMAIALRAADLALTRAGAGAIYECAAAGIPGILVPLARGASDHQRVNAAEYAATGAALVIEENNLTPNLVVGEIKRLFGNAEKLKEMGKCAKSFFKPGAAEILAREIIAATGARIA